LHYIDIAIFVLGYFILPHPVYNKYKRSPMTMGVLYLYTIVRVTRPCTLITMHFVDVL